MRVVCISDTHLKVEAGLIPEGDLLIHSGDHTMWGKPVEILTAQAWLAKLPHPIKITIPGNHDLLFQKDPTLARMYFQDGLDGMKVLIDEMAQGVLGKRVWGSPWTPKCGVGWAFQLPREGPAGRFHWENIPEALDILITHGPPLGILDTLEDGRHVGDPDLFKAVKEKKPRVHVFGHIHPGHGVFEEDGTTFVNAALLNDDYKHVYPPVVLDIQPKGDMIEVSKEEGENNPHQKGRWMAEIWPRNILTYGAGGMGKSTQAAKAAAFVYKELGLKARVVNSDGGGTESAFSPLLAKGAAEIWHIDQWPEGALFSNLELASQGWWPADTSVPGSPLLPPTKDWKPCTYCGGDSGAKGLAMVEKCATCGKPFPPGTYLKQKRDKINGFEEIGTKVFEGISSFGDLLLRRLKKIDPGGGNNLTDENFKISAPGQAHYGMAQSYLGQFINNSRRIPVPLVFWTALEIRGSEDGTPLYGPKGPGKALTTQMIPWFTDVLHLDGYPKKDKGITLKDSNGVEILERKLFLAPHFPPDNPAQKFAAKTSVPFGGDMPLAQEPDMALFFGNMVKAYAKAEQQL